MKKTCLKTLAALGLGLTAMTATATGALAEGYTIQDLGEVASRDTCLIRAERALNRYQEANGGGDVVVSDWVVYAWDFRPGDQDIALMCPIVAGDVVNAFMSVHGEDTPERRIYTTDEITRYWNQ